MTVIKRLPERAEQQYEHDSQIPKRQLGRPPKNTGQSPYLTVQVAQLRQWLNALITGAADARTPSIKKQLTEAARGLGQRLGPASLPDWEPSAAGGAVTYDYCLVLADGTEQTVSTLEQAAALYGCKPASLAVRLSQGKGKCRARRWHLGNESAVTCEKVAR